MVKNCRICSTPFRGFACDEKHKRGKYCSRKCFWIGYRIDFPRGNVVGLHWKHTEEYKKKLSIARTGKNNPSYINGQSRRRDERGRLREWRTKVFERDNYTCKKCGQRGGELNAHHIIQWCKSKEKRFDLDNGLTVCVKCHRYIHRSKNCA